MKKLVLGLLFLTGCSNPSIFEQVCINKVKYYKVVNYNSMSDVAVINNVRSCE